MLPLEGSKNNFSLPWVDVDTDPYDFLCYIRIFIPSTAYGPPPLKSFKGRHNRT